MRRNKKDSLSSFRQLIERVQLEQKGVVGPQRRWLAEILQILVLGLALGQGFGLMMGSKIHYMLLFLNTVLMVGHFKELKQQLSPMAKL